MTEEEAENINDNPIQSKANPIVPHDHDRINNVKQKESALYKAGINRYKAFLFVKESLEAVIEERLRDANGNEIIIYKPNVPRNQWAVEMIAKYFGDFVTKIEGEGNGIRQLIIIRPDGEQAERREATQTKTIPGQVYIQPEDVSRDVVLMGDRKDDVIDISGNAIQRADI